MNPIQISALVTAVALCLLALWFAVSSIWERQPRAALISAAIAFAIFVLIVSRILWLPMPDTLLLTVTSAVWLFTLLFFLPLGKPSSQVMHPSAERMDERDTVFAREEYSPGTEKYDQYYAVHPELKEADDRLRRLPELLAPGGRYYDPAGARRSKSVFRTIGTYATQVDGEVSHTKADIDPERMTAEIKELVLRLGAEEVGVGPLNPRFIYSHVGRGPEPWGQPIDLRHKFAIMFTLEMDYRRVEQAPDLPITEESGLQYLRGAIISVSLARYIRNLGYQARAHVSDSNYQIIMPAVAHDAGLGELSRMGYLISRKLGPRVRLAGVTTDLPLLTDEPVVFGVQDFCETCLKCATNCPSGSIPDGPKTTVRGVEKWQLNAESCVRYWRLAGTDCGLCMRVCPFSHPPTPIHNLVRRQIARSAIARRVSVWGDDLLYGRTAHIRMPS